jgi:hypothetical protein
MSDTSDTGITARHLTKYREQFLFSCAIGMGFVLGSKILMLRAAVGFLKVEGFGKL